LLLNNVTLVKSPSQTGGTTNTSSVLGNWTPSEAAYPGFKILKLQLYVCCTFVFKQNPPLSVPRLRRLVAGLPPWSPGFEAGSVYVEFVIDLFIYVLFIIYLKRFITNLDYIASNDRMIVELNSLKNVEEAFIA
jgi:hypothetical protein